MSLYSGQEVGRSDVCKALVLSNGEHVQPVVLRWKGEALQALFYDGTLRKAFEGLEKGLWIWEGQVVTIQKSTPNGSDCDIELDGEFREMTPEEWEDSASALDVSVWESEKEGDEPMASTPGPTFQLLLSQMVEKQNTALQHALGEYEQIRANGGKPRLSVQQDAGIVGYRVQDEREALNC
jgi:hypothetical protein